MLMMRAHNIYFFTKSPGIHICLNRAWIQQFIKRPIINKIKIMQNTAWLLTPKRKVEFLKQRELTTKMFRHRGLIHLTQSALWMMDTSVPVH